MSLDNFHEDMNYSPPTGMYTDFENTDGYNPEYVPVPGENSDEIDD